MVGDLSELNLDYDVQNESRLISEEGRNVDGNNYRLGPVVSDSEILLDGDGDC